MEQTTRKITDLNMEENCTGCAACMNFCPQKAIDMEFNEEGFLFPSINMNLCIDCGKCISVCQIAQKEVDHNFSHVLYAYAKQDKEIMKGSSGAIFPVLAQSIYENGGCVYGSAFIPDDKEVSFVSANDSGLDRIFRSKYVQSRVGLCYREVRKQLNVGETVLFSGTPCQVEGLQRFLKKDYDNLITVDFICHGVPSQKVFQNRLKYYEKKYKSIISDCTFREKDKGWRNQVIKLYFINNKEKQIPSKMSVYYNLFINNFILRKSCYSCELYKNHFSDITLADAWESNLNVGGCSKVFVNTKKGEKVLNSISNKLSIMVTEEKNIEKYKHNYSRKNREFFFKYFEKEKSNILLYEICRVKCMWSRLQTKIKSL